MKWWSVFALLVALSVVAAGVGLSFAACSPQEDDDDCAEGDCDDDDDDDDLDDDGDDDADDDTGDDDTGGEPAIIDTSRTDCKNMVSADDDWPQDLVFDYADGVLTVTHVNGVFNCCLESIDVTMELSGFDLTLFEQEVAPAPCFCVCPFDVTTRIAALDPGTYAVSVYANGVFAVDGEVTIP